MKSELNVQHWHKWLQKYFVWLLIIGFLANLSGLFITILEPDGALYATIAKTIVQSGDYINLKVEGKDWLDKPHFPFWITAISFKIFGINTIAYKLPALLFWTMGGIYTYLLAKTLNGKANAMLSVLIYISAAHLVISNNDVRAEPYLTGLIVASVYHFYRAQSKNTSFHLFIGSLFAAFAAMTKGPFVLIVIASGFIIDWIIKKKWNYMFHYKWLLAALLITVFTLPEICCLYLQFDLHPDKIVFGHTGVSGLRFFFWDSQFGRFLNNGPIKGNGDPLFFVHTVLWAFLPWSVLLYFSIYWYIRNLKKHLYTSGMIAIGTSVITFLLFSLSKFQLPHYMNIVFPFFSILSAQYLCELYHKATIQMWTWLQNILIFGLIVAVITVVIIYNIPHKILLAIVMLGLFGIVLGLFRKKALGDIIGRSFLTSILVYFFLNIFLYPNLLNYQSGSSAANFINQNNPGQTVGTYRISCYSFSFYLNQSIEYYQTPQSVKTRSGKGEFLVFMNEDDIINLNRAGISTNVLRTFPYFHVSQLTGKFLNSNTRASILKNMAVVKVSRLSN